METLENKNCVITYNPEYRWKTDAFKGSDLTDNINMPMFYNTTVRGHKKAWEQLKAKFNEHTTMDGAMFILKDAGIKTHSWCAMD